MRYMWFRILVSTDMDVNMITVNVDVRGHSEFHKADKHINVLITEYFWLESIA